jgi:hypothetical protein
LSDEDDIEVKVKLQRGTGTDNRDTWSMTVAGRTIDEVDTKVERLREHAEKWAAKFRDIQPDDGRTSHLTDDQQTLEGEEVGADA